MTAPATWFLAALTAAVTTLQTAQAEPPDAPPDAGGPVDMLRPQMMRELGLSAAQKQKLRDFRYTQEKRLIALRSDKALAELDLMKTMQTYPVHTADLVKQGQKLSAIHAQMQQLRLEGLGFFLEQLTPEQHRKFTELHEDMREQRKQKLERLREKFGKEGDKNHEERDGRRWRDGKDEHEVGEGEDLKR